MATVHWPVSAKHGALASRRAYGSIPFILLGNEDYPAEVNAYIRRRANGRAGLRRNATVSRPLAGNSIRKLVYSLSDFLTWAETSDAHPREGAILPASVREWHVVELYQDALARGHWTQSFWSIGQAIPLGSATISARIAEVIRCFRWISETSDSDFAYEPQFVDIQLSKEAALLAYRRELSTVRQELVPLSVPRVRTSPGDFPLPPVEIIKDFLECVPVQGARLALTQIFETGMRAEEVIENTLLPGRNHRRDRSGQGWRGHPSWDDRPVILRHSLSDDRMLGVLPEWHTDPQSKGQIPYRILGKGLKIRRVYLPRNLLRLMWDYADRARADLSARRQCNGEASAHLYLNRDGGKLRYHSLWVACDQANNRLGLAYRITPHVLRHAYACHFLEAALIQEARNIGADPENLSLEFLKSHGSTIALTLQSDLGHAEFATTRRYLQQIIEGRIGLRFRSAWNEFLDNEVAPSNG